MKCLSSLNIYQVAVKLILFFRKGGMFNLFLPPLVNTCATASWAHGGIWGYKIQPSSTCIILINYMHELINFFSHTSGKIYNPHFPPCLYNAFRYVFIEGGMTSCVIPPFFRIPYATCFGRLDKVELSLLTVEKVILAYKKEKNER